jgi:hypothetical protein
MTPGAQSASRLAANGQVDGMAGLRSLTSDVFASLGGRFCAVFCPLALG